VPGNELPNELIDVSLAQPNLKGSACGTYLFCEDILKAGVPFLLIDVVHAAGDY
jgi:hypothetical protein